MAPGIPQTAPFGAVFFGGRAAVAFLGEIPDTGRMKRISPRRTNMKNVMRYLGLLAKLLVFLLVLGFALKNSQSVVFYSYLGYVWQAPLIVMLGLAFVLGVLTGVLALLPTLFRLRREIGKAPVPADTETATDIRPV